MKNIHVLPTLKSSYLYKMSDGTLHISDLFEVGNSAWKNQNIYITSDEEIKEGDYFIALDGSNDIYKANKVWLDIIKENPNPSQKIILTIDQDLIKEGVQAIDDEFLKWFVNNPSCEEVEVEQSEFYSKKDFIDGKTAIAYSYKIIIPKEKPKKKHIVILVGDKVNNKQTKCYCGHTTYCDCGPETLEEAISRIKSENEHYIDEEAFELGTKWQQERSYSQLDVVRILSKYETLSNEDFNVWFEQFKKK